MRKDAFCCFFGDCNSVIAVSPVGAITGNWVEDFDHPYVGFGRLL